MKKKKSRVNEAGNYTKPTMRKNLFNREYGVLEKLRCSLANTKLREGDTGNGSQEITEVP